MFIRYHHRYRLIIFVSLLLFSSFYCFYKIWIVDEIYEWDDETNLDLSGYLSKSTFLIYPWKLSPSSATRVLSVILSSPGNFKHRSAIRKTWKLKLEQLDGFEAIFLVGMSANDSIINSRVENEAKEHGDVLLVDILEHYNNLTLKMGMLLKFVAEFHLPNQPAFLLKLDDDVFINVDYFASIFPKAQHQNHITGFVYEDTVALRWAFRNSPEEQYKWNAPKWMYPLDTYPDYVAGPMYAIPSRFIPCLYDQLLSTVPFFYIEDVYYTGILRQKCHLELKHEQSFIWADPCFENVSVVHKVDANRQFIYDRFFKSDPKKRRVLCQDLL